ncbi:MAG: hypothetical protein RLZZ312_1008 [Bacteroidota bacterium]|jgi:hypothetical protein
MKQIEKEMFHVEHFFKFNKFHQRCVFVLIFVLLSSCGISKQRIEIQDFLITENGIKHESSKPLNAFVFENDLNNQPFQTFIATYFKTNARYNSKINFSTDKSKFVLIVYDNNDFDKYFGINNFMLKNLENISSISGNNSKFIALSVVSQNNEDCLDPNSLYYNNITEFLKNLKKQYLLKNGR